MEEALKSIKKGGLNNVDVAEASGGFALAFSGGSGGQSKTKIVGNKTSVKLRDKILEWGAFKEVYTDIEKLDTDGETALCKTVKLVTDSQNCLDLDNTLSVLEMIYGLSDEKLSQMFIQRFNFADATKSALRSVYVNWVEHLETAIIEYAKARNSYIKESEKKNDVDKLQKNWEAIDAYYGIKSSSPLLLYTSFPENPYVLPWLRGTYTESDVWDIYPQTFYWEVTGVQTTKKLDDLIRKFTYLGFCPRRPKYRLQKLFEFPLEELYEATKALGGKVPNTKYQEILSLLEQKAPAPVFKVPEIPRKPLNSALSTKKQIQWYLERIIEIYETLKPHFEAVENYYSQIAKKMSSVGFKMEAL
jgi:hypothetical protein